MVVDGAANSEDEVLRHIDDCLRPFPWRPSSEESGGRFATAGKPHAVRQLQAAGSEWHVKSNSRSLIPFATSANEFGMTWEEADRPS